MGELQISAVETSLVALQEDRSTQIILGEVDSHLYRSEIWEHLIGYYPSTSKPSSVKSS